MPSHIREPWAKALVEEVRGIVHRFNAVEIENPNEGDPLLPVKTVFKCKTDKHGQIDKLKCRVVVRGDLHVPNEIIDSWNPHANYISLRMFLAFCAEHGIFPSQVDFIMAYLQAPMREKVYIQFPSD